MSEFRHETERLILRDWREGELERFETLTNTPAVMKWLGGVADKAWMAAAHARIEGYRRKFGHTFWVLERKHDGGHLCGEMLGFCGLKRSNAEGQAVEGMMEVGWRLREDAWGYGYAKEAATASLDLAFSTFGAREVVALTVAGNVASLGLMKRLEMRPRPELEYIDERYGPDMNPVIVYSVSQDTWEDKT